MTESLVLKPGAQVGSYVIEVEIGRGGMGVVYRARSARGDLRAIKTLLFGGTLAEPLVERFRREILLLASIEHAHVVRFYEAGKLATPGGTTMWIALELLEGQTLREVIDRHPRGVDPEDAARWSLHIAEGIAAAHKLGVVHRDLKPENAALTGEIVKVYDLGIAKWSGAASATAAHVQIGTLGYMAPEQLDPGVGPIDARTDVHAIGLILYELATGRNPLCPADQLLTTAEAQGRVLLFAPPPLAEAAPGFPPDLAAIADRCLKKDPEARFGTARELADALDDVLARLRARRHAVALADLGLDADAARRNRSSLDPTPPPVVAPARVDGVTPRSASDATALLPPDAWPDAWPDASAPAAPAPAAYPPEAPTPAAYPPAAYPSAAYPSAAYPSAAPAPGAYVPVPAQSPGPGGGAAPAAALAATAPTAGTGARRGAVVAAALSVLAIFAGVIWLGHRALRDAPAVAPGAGDSAASAGGASGDGDAPAVANGSETRPSSAPRPGASSAPTSSAAPTASASATATTAPPGTSVPTSPPPPVVPRPPVPKWSPPPAKTPKPNVVILD